MKEQVVRAALVATTLLTSGGSPDQAPQPNHPTAVETLTPTPEQTPDIAQVHQQLGFIAIDARGRGQAAADQLNTERFPVAQKAADNLEDATNHIIDFQLKNEGSYTVTPTSIEIAALKDAKLPKNQRRAIEEGLIEQAMKKAQDRGVEFSDNDLTVVSFEGPMPSDAAAVHAQGEDNGFHASIPVGETAVEVAVEVNPQESPGVTVKTDMHEIAHNYDVLHSNTVNCDGFLELPGKSDKLPLIMTDSIAESCSSVEYGDKTTIMGGAELKTADLDPLNAFQLLQFGALPPEQVKDINKAGVYELELNALRNPTKSGTKLIRIDLPKGVKVPLSEANPNSHYAYVLELSSNAAKGLAIKLMLVSFNAGGEPTGSTYAIPLNPAGSAGDPSLDPKFRGEVFGDSRFGLKVSVNDLTATGSRAQGSAILRVSRSK